MWRPGHNGDDITGSCSDPSASSDVASEDSKIMASHKILHVPRYYILQY